MEEPIEPETIAEEATEEPTGRAVLSAPGDAVPVAYLPTPIAAHMVRSILEGAGIRAAVVGEHTTNLLAQLGPALMVTVLVSRGDYPEAALVLRQEIMDPQSPSKSPRMPTCPACGYDLSGLDSQGKCPECAWDIRAYADLRRLLAIAPPPAATGLLVNFGALMGVLVIIVVIVVGVIAFAGLWRHQP